MTILVVLRATALAALMLGGRGSNMTNATNSTKPAGVNTAKAAGPNTTKPTVSNTTKPVGFNTTKPAGSTTTKPTGSTTTKPTETKQTGSNTTRPAGSNTTKEAGSNTSKPEGFNTTKPAGSNATKPAGSNTTEPSLSNTSSNTTTPAGNDMTQPASSTIDVFLLIFVLCVVVGAIYANTRILMFYMDPADDGLKTSWFVKSVIVISLTLCWLMNILLPIDVRNSRPVPGFLDMSIIWTVAFSTLAFFLLVVIPATMFYYEAEGDVAIGKKVKRHVMCNMLFMIFFVGGALGISYAFLSHASVPVREYRCPETHWLDASAALTPSQVGAKTCAEAVDAFLEFKVGMHIYMVAFMCFIGWFFFVTFGGIGLSALPIDLILEFVDRPRAIDEVFYQQERREIGRASGELLSRAEKLQELDSQLSSESGWRARRRKRALQADYNKFKTEVTHLEEDYERLLTSKHQKGESILVSAVKLTLGIIFAILSFAWILHTVFYILVRKLDPTFSFTFLNAFFSAFEGPGLYPVGVALFGAFNLYLLLCVVKGTLKFGMRIFILFSIHPMKRQATPLNSILFNVLMMVISSAAVVQFAQEAFSDYARLTDADVLFSAQIKYLSFYSYFFDNNIFLYALLGWFVLTILFLSVVGQRERKSALKRRKAYVAKKDKKDKSGKPSKSAKKGDVKNEKAALKASA